MQAIKLALSLLALSPLLAQAEQPASQPATQPASQPVAEVFTPAPGCLLTAWLAEKRPVDKIRQSFTEETLGGLKLGMTEAQLVELLEEPDSKSEPEEEAATGHKLSEWIWAKRGIAVSVDVQAEATTVVSINVLAPFDGRTSCGVGLGDPLAKAQAIYGAYLDADFTREGHLVVGSIYGGLAITAREGKINGIMLGAFAE